MRYKIPSLILLSFFVFELCFSICICGLALYGVVDQKGGLVRMIHGQCMMEGIQS